MESTGSKMAQVIKIIEIEGQPAVALFDTGATWSYGRSPLVRKAPRRAMIPPARVGLGLGGKGH